MDAVLEFHHLGLLSSRPRITAERLRGLGYTMANPVVDLIQGTTLQMATSENGSPAIEVITPLEAGSPLGRQLKTRDNSIYHMCFTATEFREVEIALQGDDGRIFIVSKPEPAILFEGRKVAFYFVDGLGLVEILETGHKGDSDGEKCFDGT